MKFNVFVFVVVLIKAMCCVGCRFLKLFNWKKMKRQMRRES